MKKLHWRVKAKREIARWERNLQKVGRKNRWSISKSSFTKKYGLNGWKVEERRRKSLEKSWKKKRDAKRYEIEKLKDKLNPKRVKERKLKRGWRRMRKKIKDKLLTTDEAKERMDRI